MSTTSDTEPRTDDAREHAAGAHDPGGDRGPLARLRGRAAKDLRDALVDPEDTPAGDFDLALGGGVRRSDRIAGFNGLITAMRWQRPPCRCSWSHRTGLHPLAAPLDRGAGDYAIVRAFRPISYAGDVASMVRVLAEVALHAVAVTATGAWDSPLLFTFAHLAGRGRLARGLRGSRCGWRPPPSWGSPSRSSRQPTIAASAGAVGLVVADRHDGRPGRRLRPPDLRRADRERELAFDRLGRLEDANSLLFSLHRVTQTLPASLDLGEVLDSTLSRLKTLVAYDSVAILLLDETDGHWDVARHKGLVLPNRIDRATADGTPTRGVGAVAGPCAGPVGRSGRRPVDRAGSGIYAVLAARGAVIGLLAVEHGDLDHFSERDLELIQGFVAPVALAVDNARWFARLRTVGGRRGAHTHRP